MTTLPDRPRTALLVVDLQDGVLEGTHDTESVVANATTLVDKARSEEVAVVWVQQTDDNLPEGSERWQLAGGLSPRDTERRVLKEYADSFEETELESVLAAAKVGRLFVIGAQTDECVRSTLHGAIVRGYDAILVGDAHTTEDLTEWGAPSPDLVIAHTNLYWGGHRAPGRTAGTVTTKEVNFS
ncbi:MAG TPA: isochorismatase family protein [Stackebrandtia sp.]|jgi:nicotinamidase-related amidase|uniref:isochorismatase family protein n=1 Tax=Stackebrandtia sp. TaxID=2023065 RepID=UPI002D555E3D|nr:isochorismatase family protein [Stackebrandtia sp.]HZE42032.1 isochorismatase family protein [Stackebrandtia sp.]